MKRISLNKVMAKLAEEQRVDLSLKEDVIKLEKRAEGFRSAALKQLEGAIESYEAAAQTHGVALDAAEKGLAAAKEVGFDEGIKMFSKSVSFNEGTIKAINKIVSTLRSNRLR